jgi:hypothetical protein
LHCGLRNYNRLCRCVAVWIGLLFEEDSWRTYQQWWYSRSPIHWRCLDNFVLCSGIAIIFSDIIVLFFDSSVLFVGIVVLFDIIINSSIIIIIVGNSVINNIDILIIVIIIIIIIDIIILVRNANKLTEQ